MRNYAISTALVSLLVAGCDGNLRWWDGDKIALRTAPLYLCHATVITDSVVGDEIMIDLDYILAWTTVANVDRIRQKCAKYGPLRERRTNEPPILPSAPTPATPPTRTRGPVAAR